MLAPPPTSAPAPAIVVHAAASTPASDSPALKVHGGPYGGLAFLSTGSALRAKGITITNRLVLKCGVNVPASAAHAACGLGAPSYTASSGSISPTLTSGSANATVDLKFVRGARSLAISVGKLTASGGVLTVVARINGSDVSLGTEKPKGVRSVSDVTFNNAPLKLTAAGAKALGNALGTSLSAGGTIATFGGNIVFKQANVVSGAATLDLPRTVTPTATGKATGGPHNVNLTVLPQIAALSNFQQALNGTLHLGGGMSLTIGKRTVTITDPGIVMHGDTTNNREDQLVANVNGKHVTLANMSDPNLAQDSGATESDDYTKVTLTSAGAKALGSPFKAGSSFGTLMLDANIGG
jgi:hypothetical protein